MKFLKMNDMSKQEYEQRPYTEPQTHEEEMRRLVRKDLVYARTALILSALSVILIIVCAALRIFRFV